MATQILVRRGLAVALLATLAACGGGGGGGGGVAFPVAQTAPVAAAPAKPVCTVTLYGDSILYGTYSPDGVTALRLSHYPAEEIRAQRPAYTVDDRTKPGQSLLGLTYVFANDSRSSRFVVVESGVIDSWYGDAVGERLKNIVDYIKAEGRTPVITGYSRQVVRTDRFAFLTAGQVANHDAWNAAAKYVADQTGAVFADWSSVRFDGEVDIVDTVHPSEAYSMRLSAALIAALDKAAPECR